jgi:GNAT superfamily N-acetyltransferase
VTVQAPSPLVHRPVAWPVARRTEPADVPALLDFLSDGLRGYQAFADPRTYSRLVEADGHIVGFVHSCQPDPPVEVRLRYLFVSQSHWGSGLAHELHDGAVAAMGGRTARLFTPTDHARARRFYARRGWRYHGPEEGSKLGLHLAEYRRP